MPQEGNQILNIKKSAFKAQLHKQHLSGLLNPDLLD